MKARLDWKHRALALLLLALFFARGVAAIPRLSLTADEPAFVGPGLAYLQTGDLRLEQDAAHPPLLFVLAAAPLLLQPTPDVTALPGWAEGELSPFARAFVASLGDGLAAATLAMRLPTLLLALVGAAFVLRWATDRFGPWAGLLALTLFTFDPNILAHATLATTDLGLAALGFIGAYLLYRLLRRPSAALYLATGIVLGLTLSSKSSGFLVLLILTPLFLVTRLVSHKTAPLRALAEAAGLVGLAALVMWALYRFELRPVSGWGGMPLPFATQWEIWRSTQTHAREGHTAFLMGRISGSGWWYYYPLAFLLKTPLPTLLLLTAAMILKISESANRQIANPKSKIGKSANRQIALRWAWLVLYPVIYAVATLFSTIAIGYRFLLVILPFLYVFIAQLAEPPSRITFYALRFTLYALRFTLYVLLAWLVVASFLVSPHYLAYFNELAGGPAGGYRYLVDSNLDWGQSFVALRSYLDEEGIDEVYLSYYTYADPALYGIRYEPIAPAPNAPPTLPARFDPAPGVYVIGATTLQGVMMVDADTYDWFRHREPLARPGFALFVYRVTPHEKTPTWLAQCDRPVAPLSTEAAAEGFGRSGLRMAYFDCTSAWLYPDGGESPGWYAFFRDTARGDPFIHRRLAAARLSYEQRRPGALPPFAIYEQGIPPTPPAPIVAGSIRVGALTFLGYTSSGDSPRPGQTVEVETWWRVESLPERPLSIMLHLTGPGGVPVVVGDGLGVPVEQWQVGDIIVQRHLLPIPADVPPGEYVPTTGVYWLDTLERWPVEINGTPAGDQVALPALAVTR